MAADGEPRPVLRRAALAEILALRHAVLRPGLPPGAARFEGDEEDTTFHFGAFAGGEAVGCLTLVRRGRGEAPYQLRGMATRADCRGTGIGRALLAFAERALGDETGARALWCNARVESVGFYERAGWDVASGPFAVPGVGPHRVMTRRLPRRA